jgi:hypothetical protein
MGQLKMPIRRMGMGINVDGFDAVAEKLGARGKT